MLKIYVGALPAIVFDTEELMEKNVIYLRKVHKSLYFLPSGKDFS